MGFFNSLKSQVGRDAGRAVSNTIFGGRHTSSRSKTSNNTVKAQKIRLEIEEKKLEAEERKLQAEQDIIEKQRLDQVTALIDKKVAKIISIKIPVKKEAIIALLQELSILLMSNKWNNGGREAEISNAYSDAILKKYEQGLDILKSKYSKEPIINVFNKEHKKFKRMRFYSKYGIGIGILVFFIFGFTLMAISAFFSEKSY